MDHHRIIQQSTRCASLTISSNAPPLIRFVSQVSVSCNPVLFTARCHLFIKPALYPSTTVCLQAWPHSLITIHAAFHQVVGPMPASGSCDLLRSTVPFMLSVFLTSCYDRTQDGIDLRKHKATHETEERGVLVVMWLVWC